MATTFNMLRANDLIWSFVINNYLLGKQPMPFDLLYWNSDTTRMPEKMHLSYLRECYKDNALAQGKMVLGGVKLDLSKVKVPVYLQSAKEDHIAPSARSSRRRKLFSGPVRFIIAGIGPYRRRDQSAGGEEVPVLDQRKDAGDRRRVDAGATEHPGSWWPDWDKWLSKLSGKEVPARKPGDGKLQTLAMRRGPT